MTRCPVTDADMCFSTCCRNKAENLGGTQEDLISYIQRSNSATPTSSLFSRNPPQTSSSLRLLFYNTSVDSVLVLEQMKADQSVSLLMLTPPLLINSNTLYVLFLDQIYSSEGQKKCENYRGPHLMPAEGSPWHLRFAFPALAASSWSCGGGGGDELREFWEGVG